MNAPIQPPQPRDPRGSMLLGFALAWAALIGGYFLAIGLMASLAQAVGGSDSFFITIGVSPWLLVIGLIAWFASQGKTQTAKGVALGLASIVALLLLLVAACFSLFSSNSFR